MARTKNVAGKARYPDKGQEPYLTITLFESTWQILKANTVHPLKPYASALLRVQTPATFGGWDMGDNYLDDLRWLLMKGAEVTYYADDVFESRKEAVMFLLGVEI